MTSPLPFLAALAFGLGACTSDPEPAISEMTALDDSAGLLTLDEDGIEGLGSATPFDTAAVRAALPPGFAVELHSAETVAGLGPVAWAFRDGQLVLEVYPDPGGATIGRIDAASEQVTGPEGLRVGRTFAEAGGEDMDCEPGTEELSGRAVCRPPSSGPLRYVFASRYTGPDGALPPPDSLANALLERIVWTAD